MATIRREEDRLLFQWAKTAVPSSANYLRNCILQVRVEGKSKYVTLTGSKPAEPIRVDLGRGAVSATIPVKWLPDAANLRIEITEIEGQKDYSLSPPEPADAKTPLELRFDRTDRHGNTATMVAFKLTFTARPAAMLARLQLLEPPSTYFRTLNRGAAAQRNPLEVMRDQIQKQLNPKDKEKAPRGDQRALLNMQLTKLEKAMWYIDFYNAVQDKAKIHFRILTEVDGRQVVLASTKL